MPIRSIGPSDEQALIDFVAAIPERDRNFFKEDVTDSDVLGRWLLEGSRDVRIISADENDAINAIATVAPGVGRCAHVGDLRLVVAATARRRGVGRNVTQRALVRAVEEGMTKIMVEVAAEQQGAINMFRDLGFVPEALLGGQLRDPDGDVHDIILLAHTVDANWSGFLSSGVAGEIG